MKIYKKLKDLQASFLQSWEGLGEVESDGRSIQKQELWTL